MVLKELAKAAWSQPVGPSEVPGGGAHVDAEYALRTAAHEVAKGNPGGALASMAAGGRGSPPVVWNDHMEMRPDHGLWKDGQGAPRGVGGVVLPPRPAPRPLPR